MKHLNSKAQELFSGRKISYRGKIYWANMTTMEVYAQSIDADISGSVNGYKVANISADWRIVKA